MTAHADAIALIDLARTIPDDPPRPVRVALTELEAAYLTEALDLFLSVADCNCETCPPRRAAVQRAADALGDALDEAGMA